jgi:ABC-type branched-subunit amino acid transport system permease subunit
MEVSIRRVPRFLPFILTGGILGVLIALLIGLSIPEEQRTAEPIVTFLVAYIGGIGVVLGIVAALILDRVGQAKAKRAEATKIVG